MKYNLAQQHYMNAIELAEQNSNLLTYITRFFTSQDRTIITQISTGTIMIPSPALLNESLNSLSSLNLKYKTIALYKKCISLSENFYLEMITSMIKSQRNEFSYNSYFNNVVKVYGIDFISNFEKLGQEINSYYLQNKNTLITKRSQYLALFTVYFLLVLLMLLELHQEIIKYPYIIGLPIISLLILKYLSRNTQLNFKKNDINDIYGQNGSVASSLSRHF